jgi:hypothetical protein
MSGYLERIGMSAMKPGGSIHPVLGSVFSASRYDPRPGTLPWEVDARAAPEPEILVTMRRDEPHVFEPSQRATGKPDAPIPPVPPMPMLLRQKATEKEDSRPAFDEPTPFKPLAREILPRDRTRQADALAVPHVRNDNDARRSETDDDDTRPVSRDREVRHTEAPRAPLPQRREHQVIVTGVFRPLVAGIDGSAAEASILGGRHDPIASTALKQEKRSESRRGMKRPEVKSDDIQIHIGRIEVTAVPQPAAPTAAPRPAPKSASLSEYLKRRDTRAL